jgi:hypothetical protein
VFPGSKLVLIFYVDSHQINPTTPDSDPPMLLPTPPRHLMEWGCSDIGDAKVLLNTKRGPIGMSRKVAMCLTRINILYYTSIVKMFKKLNEKPK